MSLKKGIKGQLRSEWSLEAIKRIQDNADAFLNIVENDLPECEYDIYEGRVGDTDVICIDFNILGVTAKACKSELSYFKKELKRVFNIKISSRIEISYEKI